MSKSREPSAIDVVKFYREYLEREGESPPKRFVITTADFEVLAGVVEMIHGGMQDLITYTNARFQATETPTGGAALKLRSQETTEPTQSEEPQQPAEPASDKDQSGR